MNNAAAQPGVPAGNRSAFLEVRGLSKRFGGLLANDDISLGVTRGDIVAIIGPNGSGKTTLLDAICGLLSPDAGEIWFDGQPLRGLPTAAIARQGLMRTFQQTGVYDQLTSLQNVEASIDRAGEPPLAWWRRADPAVQARARECLAFVGLADHGRSVAGELSYGQRKLLELAMALMSRPRMLLLDEPTAGVSPAMVPEVVQLLRRANSELGITVLFIEHNMQVVSTLAHRLHCLVRGRLIASGRPDEVRSDPRVIEAYLGGT